MPICIFFFNKFIHIYKIFISCIVWWINIDYIYLSFMCFFQQFKTV